jgi:hypothetical protein
MSGLTRVTAAQNAAATRSRGRNPVYTGVTLCVRDVLANVHGRMREDDLVVAVALRGFAERPVRACIYYEARKQRLVRVEQSGVVMVLTAERAALEVAPVPAPRADQPHGAVAARRELIWEPLQRAHHDPLANWRLCERDAVTAERVAQFSRTGCA